MDSGALLAAQRDDKVFWSEWKRAVGAEVEFHLPSIVLTQVWRGGSNPLISKVILACRPVPIDFAWAKTAGVLLAETGMRDTVGALVAAVASRYGDEVWCSDPDDLRALASVATDGRGLVIRRF